MFPKSSVIQTELTRNLRSLTRFQHSLEWWAAVHLSGGNRIEVFPETCLQMLLSVAQMYFGHDSLFLARFGTDSDQRCPDCRLKLGDGNETDWMAWMLENITSKLDSPTQSLTTTLNSPIGVDLPKAQLIHQLRGQIREAETVRRNDDELRISSGCSAVDDLLPEGGYARGTIAEWLTDGPGNAAEYLSLATARNACADGGALVIVDPYRQFHPPAVAAMGIDLGNLIVLRPNNSKSSRPGNASAPHSDFQNDLFWSVEQALRSTAVGAVWGQFESINERWYRRFQLSAEASGCFGLFIRPSWTRRQPSWSDIQWRVRSLATPKSTAQNRDPLTPTTKRHVSLQLVRCKTGQSASRSGGIIQLEIDTVTGSVQRARSQHATRLETRPLPVAAKLAHPTNGRRAQRA